LQKAKGAYNKSKHYFLTSQKKATLSLLSSIVFLSRGPFYFLAILARSTRQIAWPMMKTHISFCLKLQPVQGIMCSSIILVCLKSNNAIVFQKKNYFYYKVLSNSAGDYHSLVVLKQINGM